MGRMNNNLLAICLSVLAVVSSSPTSPEPCLGCPQKVDSLTLQDKEIVEFGRWRLERTTGLISRSKIPPFRGPAAQLQRPAKWLCSSPCPPMRTRICRLERNVPGNLSEAIDSMLIRLYFISLGTNISHYCQNPK